jgi:hypothetical protein
MCGACSLFNIPTTGPSRCDFCERERLREKIEIMRNENKATSLSDDVVGNGIFGLMKYAKEEP